MIPALLVMMAVAAEPAPAPPRASGAMLVAIPTARIVGEVPLRAQAAFELSLAAEVRKREGVAAVGGSEIGDVLSTAAEGRMRGCTQDDACLLEVASAIGLNEILSAEVVLERDTYAMTFRRLSARTGKSLATTVRHAQKGNGVELLDAIGPVVETLYQDRALKAGAIVGVDSEVAHRLNPPPLSRWIFAATATAAGVSLAAGATFGKLSSDARHDLKALVDRSQQQPVSGAQLVTLQDRLDTNARFANVFLGTGAALATAACVEAFFTDWHDYRSQLHVIPAAKGAGVGVSTRF
jgi:hypothetical protein